MPQALNATQLEIAKRVHTGKAACEFDQSVSVTPVSNHPGHFTLGFKNVSYTMVPEATTTGAVRLEDKKAGVVWIQIANKSMLMNAKAGQRMVDACQHAEQRAFAEANRGAAKAAADAVSASPVARRAARPDRSSAPMPPCRRHRGFCIRGAGARFCMLHAFGAARPTLPLLPTEPLRMTRVFNFSAGPAALPEPVLRKAAEEMLDWHGSGMSVMEMSHRGKEFIAIHAEAESLLRELLAVPANYKVLFLQGGAIGQNAFVPMNLLRGKTSADYVNTGEWSKKSIKEAQKYCTVNVAATAEASHFTQVPKQDTWKLDPNAAYVHICSNETIGGVEYHWTPDTGDVPLVADMSSNLMSRPVDVSRYGVIYAGAQKNIGPAGVTIVIVRDDLIGHAASITPSAFDYKQQADNDSMLNTPPTYAIYIAGLVFQWLKAQGGLRGDGSAQPREGRAAVRLSRLDLVLQEPGRARGPLADERAVQAARRVARRSVPERRANSATCCSSKAIARSAACARRSTTRCRSKA